MDYSCSSVVPAAATGKTDHCISSWTREPLHFYGVRLYIPLLRVAAAESNLETRFFGARACPGCDCRLVCVLQGGDGRERDEWKSCSEWV